MQEKAVGVHTHINECWEGVAEKGKPVVFRNIETTPGRVMLGELLPKSSKISFELVNKLMTKREISSMIDQVYCHCGQKETVILCDRIMAIGLYHALQDVLSLVE